MKNLLQASLIVMTGALANVAAADTGQFYIAPGVQWMDFDEEVFLDNDWGFSAGLGYQFAERWSVELGTFDLDPQSQQTGSDVDIDNYRLDFIYDIGQSFGNWQPFLVGGIGNVEFAGSNDSIMDLGAGLKLKLSDNLEWRTALRTYNYLGRDNEDSDLGVDTALVLYFGGNKSAPARSTRTAESSSRAPAAAPASTSRPEVARNEAPAADADRDGVPDSADNCADTPRNYAVDAQGCPIPVEEVARVELLVNFDFDRSEVRPQYFDEIEEVADFMEQYPDVVIELEGHTDSRGAADYNQGLSERRANAVRQVLLDRFNVSAARVSASGFGESQPIASNDTDAGRADNRRVITVIIKTLQNYQPR